MNSLPGIAVVSRAGGNTAAVVSTTTYFAVKHDDKLILIGVCTERSTMSKLAKTIL